MILVYYLKFVDCHHTHLVILLKVTCRWIILLMASKHKQMGPLMFILLDEHFQKFLSMELTPIFVRFK